MPSPSPETRERVTTPARCPKGHIIPAHSIALVRWTGHCPECSMDEAAGNWRDEEVGE